MCFLHRGEFLKKVVVKIIFSHALLRITLRIVLRHIGSRIRQKESTTMVVLDIEKAFDTVWFIGLIYKLIKYGFPSYIVLLIASYLSNRGFKVLVEETIKQISAGVPQGSILGPILFILFISDIPKHPKTDFSVFADDKINKNYVYIYSNF
jgi:hypothetical protein